MAEIEVQEAIPMNIKEEGVDTVTTLQARVAERQQHFPVARRKGRTARVAAPAASAPRDPVKQKSCALFLPELRWLSEKRQQLEKELLILV